jgi:hypothetical protein
MDKIQIRVGSIGIFGYVYDDNDKLVGVKIMDKIQTLRDSSNRIFGYIYDGGDRLVLVDDSNRTLGYYYKREDVTRDMSNRIIGYGNLLLTLLK